MIERDVEFNVVYGCLTIPSFERREPYAEADRLRRSHLPL
jgi:hypothetical protein